MTGSGTEHLRGPIQPDDRARLGHLLETVFALPSSGRFVSLLDAIDQADRRVTQGGSEEKDPSAFKIKD